MCPQGYNHFVVIQLSYQICPMEFEKLLYMAAGILVFVCRKVHTTFLPTVYVIVLLWQLENVTIIYVGGHEPSEMFVGYVTSEGG